MGEIVEGLGLFIVPAVGAVALFTFLAVASWAESRQKEREAFYRSETLRKAIEQGGESAQSVLQIMREDELQKMRRRIDGLRLGGLITAAVGTGLMVFLYAMVPDEPVWLVGVIPLLIGIVLAGYGFLSRADPVDAKRLP
jgi:hypothetical protein